jgi:hypothetical protein
MPSLPAVLKGCNFLITLAISSSESDMEEGILAGYEALGISVWSAFGIGGRNWDLKLQPFQVES